MCDRQLSKSSNQRLILTPSNRQSPRYVGQPRSARDIQPSLLPRCTSLFIANPISQLPPLRRGQIFLVSQLSPTVPHPYLPLIRPVHHRRTGLNSPALHTQAYACRVPRPLPSTPCSSPFYLSSKKAKTPDHNSTAAQDPLSANPRGNSCKRGRVLARREVSELAIDLAETCSDLFLFLASTRA